MKNYVNEKLNVLKEFKKELKDWFDSELQIVNSKLKNFPKYFAITSLVLIFSWYVNPFWTDGFKYSSIWMIVIVSIIYVCNAKADTFVLIMYVFMYTALVSVLEHLLPWFQPIFGDLDRAYFETGYNLLNSHEHFVNMLKMIADYIKR